MKVTGGFRSRTRQKLRKKARNRGKVNINKLLEEHKIGARVRIMQEPAVQAGMPYPRYKNLVGNILGKQGGAYIVEIKDLGKKKKLIASGIHLAKV